MTANEFSHEILKRATSYVKHLPLADPHWISSQKKKRDINGPLDTFDGPQRKSHTRELGLQGRAFHLVTSRQRRHWPKIYSVCDTSPLHLAYLSLVKIVFLWANGIIHATAPEVGRKQLNPFLESD